MDIETTLLKRVEVLEDMSTMIEQGVKPAWFQNEWVREAFEYSAEYHITSGFTKTVDRDLLAQTFDEVENLDWDQKEDEYLVGALIEILRKRFKRLNVQKILLEAGESIYDRDPDEALNQALGDLSSVQFDSSTLDRIDEFKPNFPARVDGYFDRVLNSVEPVPMGHFLGWDMVTEAIYGLKEQELAILAALPGTGKSYFMCKVAIEAAMRGSHVYLASLENPKEMTQMRLDVILAGIPWKEYERGQLTSEQTQRLVDAKEQMEDMKGKLIVDSPKYRSERTIFEIYSRARYYDSDFIIGDQLSWVTPRKSYGGSRTAQMEEVVQDINDYGREYNVASLWASQLNRKAAEDKKGGSAHHMSLSSMIEQTAAFVFKLRRTEELAINQKAVLQTLKNRRGEVKSWLLDWVLSGSAKLEAIGEYEEPEE